MQNFRLGRRLTFANLWFCGSLWNFFPQIWGRSILSAAKASSFSVKIVFSSIRQVFSHQSFRYTVLPRLHDPVADWISGKDQRLAQCSYSLARCGWLAILRRWAGEHRKIRVSPEKSGWVGRSDIPTRVHPETYFQMVRNTIGRYETLYTNNRVEPHYYVAITKFESLLLSRWT